FPARRCDLSSSSNTLGKSGVLGEVRIMTPAVGPTPPTDPAIGQFWIDPDGTLWVWDGTKWTRVTGPTPRCDDLAGLRYSDLVNKRIVSSRSDLNRKQRELGFPKPVKTGPRSAWWFESEIRAWLLWRASLRHKQAQEKPRTG